jgi:hypothetical protein
VEHSAVSEAGGELRFQTPRDYRVSMKEADLRKALQRLGAGTMKINIAFTDSDQAAGSEEPRRDEGEIAGRALAHPEVQRFRETFDGQVRAVRNLKE